MMDQTARDECLKEVRCRTGNATRSLLASSLQPLGLATDDDPPPRPQVDVEVVEGS